MVRMQVGIVVLLAGGWGAAIGQQAANRSCPVAVVVAPGEAQRALNQGRFEDAERIFQAMPASSEATAGRVRAELGERRLDDALALIRKESAAHENDALLMDVLGEVRFRRGEVNEAALAYNRSITLDPCLAWTHYDVGRYINLNGLYASGQTQLDQAHKLAPNDPVISRVWNGTQRVPVTPEEQVARLQRRETNASLSEEQKTAVENAMKAVQARRKGDCEMAKPMDSAKIPLPSVYPSQNSDRIPRGSGVDVMLNGKRRRFLLDTGASGLMLSKDAAKALGLSPEAEVKTSGIGDEGARSAFLAHVDTVGIGGMEFHNCMVRVEETKEGLNVDGLLGPDIFRDFLVTLDFPSYEIRLSSLPPRPDEAAKSTSLGTEGGDQSGEDDEKPLTLAQRRRDRYVAPEMATWTRLFRSGHDLIVPVTIGNAPKKLFILDTGAGSNLISPAAAREVSSVTGDRDARIHGISGEVKNVYSTGPITLEFANVRQQSMGLTSIDTSFMSRSTGVEISGFIGYPILRELVMQIDYRDNLLHVKYTPHVEPGAH